MSKQKQDFYKAIKFDEAFWQKSAQQVLAWNLKSRLMSLSQYQEKIENDELFRQAEIANQTTYLLEELKEYRDALNDNNHVEMLDASADIFVVASFLTYQYFASEVALHSILTQLPADILSDNPYEVFLRMTERKDVSLEMVATSVATVMLQARNSLIRTNYNGKATTKVVLSSNDSKYPNKKQLTSFHNVKDINEAVKLEEKWIETHRGKESVKGVWNEEYKVWVFRDNGGEGKIMKPSSFKEPTSALNKIVFGE